MYGDFAPLLGERHAHHRSAVGIHGNGDFVPKLFDLAEGLGKKQMYLANMPPFLRKIVLKELKKRWVLDEGLVESPLATRDAHNLPPDRTMLGRAFWTYIHTVTMYLRHRPSGRQLASFRAIFSAIYHVRKFSNSLYGDFEYFYRNVRGR